ncbi:phosphate acetyltransferase [Pseudoramibacter alactolyticus]
MSIFNEFKSRLQSEKKTIVFTEGEDLRIQAAAERLTQDGTLQVLLIGSVDAIQSSAQANGFDISQCQIIDPLHYADIEAMVKTMMDLRKGKMTEEQVRESLTHSNYFGTMLVKMGKADCLLGGATYSTADTVRPALQLIKTKPGAHLVSSTFILMRNQEKEKLAFADCAINIDYQDRLDKDGNVTLSAAKQLAEVAVESAKTAQIFGIDPKVAILSFSTKGSGKGGTVQLSHDATIEAQKLAPELAVDGELQFDAAVSPAVAQTKCPNSKVAGEANTFIFPTIEAGNLGYKIASRLGGFEAFGPILQGLNAPINDLSRGCNADEVYKMSLITAALG